MSYERIERKAIVIKRPPRLDDVDAETLAALSAVIQRAMESVVSRLLLGDIESASTAGGDPSTGYQPPLFAPQLRRELFEPDDVIKYKVRWRWFPR